MAAIQKYICDGCKQERALPVYRTYGPSDFDYLDVFYEDREESPTLDICSSCDIAVVATIKGLSG